MENKRIKTYIKGFDNLIQGGFPRNSNILISGKPGTGKTIFSIQYLINGVRENNEIGIYFSFEEKKEDIIEQAEQFDFNLKNLELKGKIKVISLGIDDINKGIINDILEIIKNTNTKRVVIDSITTLAYLNPKEDQNNIDNLSIKKFLYTFISKLKENSNFTTLIISQKDEEVADSISRYICDGVIDIEYESMGGDFSRNLIINKMRKTKNDEDIHPLEISEKGIIIHNLD